MFKSFLGAAVLAAVVSSTVPPANAEVDVATITNRKEVIHTCLLNIYLQQKKRAQAISEYQILVAMKPTDSKLLYQYGVYLFQGGTPADYSASLTQLKKAVTLEPQNPQINGVIGSLYLKLKNPREALTWFGKACQCGGGPEYKKLFEETSKYIQASEAAAAARKKIELQKKQQLELQKKQGTTPKGPKGDSDDDDW
jgi:Tfp pilus assembly protein PilF